MKLLTAYEVDTVFGMAGTMTVELYRGIAVAGIRHVQCRNEQGASLMADGYARATSKPGVCTIIAGPGVTNAATGIAQAYCDSQPMLVLSGACATLTQGKGWGAIHELADQAAVTAGFTAFSAMIRYPEELPELVARAYAVFRGSRPRPVHLSLPRDVLPEPVEDDWKTRRAPSLPMPDPAAIDEAADRLAQAKRPLILVGGGAVGTRKALTAIAERIGAPVLSTNAGKGILPESHPLSLGCSILQKPSQQALAAADVVLLVGSEVAQGDHFLPKLDISGDIIRIDIDPTELTSLYSAAVPIQADARAAMLALSSGLSSRKPTAQPPEGEMRVRDILTGNAREYDRPRKAARARMEDTAFSPSYGRHRDGRRLADCVHRQFCNADGNGALLVLFRHVLFPGRRLADGHWREDRRAASASDCRRGRRRDHVHGQ